MKPWIAVAAFGALLALWAAVQLVFSPDAITVLLLGGSALAVAVLAAVVAAAGREEPHRAVVPELSVATVITAAGVAGVITGIELGTWSIAMGGLVAAFGIAGLVRERRAQPRPPREGPPRTREPPPPAGPEAAS